MSFNNRLEHLFARNKGNTTFVSFFMGCDPNYKKSLSILLEAAKSGSDILEIGFANSEASSEGPIIQAASERALKAGGNLNRVIKLAADVRKRDKKVSIVLMGYISNIFMYPMDKFVKDIAKADIDGILVIDCPHETVEENKLRELLSKHDICLIKLIAPTTTQNRIKEIVKISRGFIYAVNVKGITGVKTAELGSVKNMIKKIKKYTDLPICSGFGIKNSKDARVMSKSGAEGIVMGSSLVDIVAKNLKLNEKKIATKVGNYIKNILSNL
jgi:tryptophan synthase alpha chain